MVGQWIRFGFCAFFVICGLTAVVAATVGVYRFKDDLCKMHAAAMIDTLAFSSFTVAALIAFGFGIENLKMLLAVVFLWITSPACSHLLSRLEFTTGVKRENTEAGGRVEEETDQPVDK